MLLKQERHQLKYMMDQHELRARLENGLVELADLIESRVGEQSDRGTSQYHDLANKLRSSFRTSSPMRQTSADATDPFSFTATIIRAHEDESDHIVARGKLDSGCDDNWVALELLQRGEMAGQLETVADGEMYFAFGGEPFSPKGQIDITWYALNAGKSRCTSFLVHEKPPFDLVLGRTFILEESIFMFDKSALILAHSDFTKGKNPVFNL